MKKVIFVICLITTIVVISGCIKKVGEDIDGQQTGLANPAAVYCLEHGGSLQPQQNQGGSYSNCVFADGSYCEEWAYFRGECQPGDSLKNNESEQIISFEECAAAGYVILETYPKQCQTPDNRIFTEETVLEDQYSLEQSQQLAQEWIEKNCQTYIYDGVNLQLAKSEVLRCPGCYQFIFTFQSSQAGYGDRSDKMSAQVITDHELQVAMEQGKINKAVTDNLYDELNQSMLDK